MRIGETPRILSQKEAQTLTYYWQNLLKLNDWDVLTKIVRARDMVISTESEAEITWLHEKKTAVIFLLDPIDYDPAIPIDQNHEHSIIHELLHLHMIPFDAEDGTPAGIAQEQMIHILASVLLRLNNRGRVPSDGE